MNPVKQSERLTRPMRAIGKKRMEDLQWRIYLREDLLKTAYLPPEVFLPNDIIKGVLDRFALLTDFSSLNPLFDTHTFAEPHQIKLYALIIELRAVFSQMRAEKRKNSTQTALGIDGIEGGSSSSGGGIEEDDGTDKSGATEHASEGDDRSEVIHPRLTIRIPLEAARSALASLPISPPSSQSTASSSTRQMTPPLPPVPALQAHNTPRKRAASTTMESPKGKVMHRTVRSHITDCYYMFI